MGSFMFGLYVGAHTLCTTVGWNLAWKYALVLHVLSWYMQVRFKLSLRASKRLV
jgi:hypothetical protein